MERFFPRKGDVLGWISCIVSFMGIAIGLAILTVELILWILI